ncbi:MAG: DEAD/DEAH box helicase [Deltaproteobacteria bacterium]|nr:DEAD/DEAH box helicase [Deltaproteobacteria bacterium]
MAPSDPHAPDNVEPTLQSDCLIVASLVGSFNRSALSDAMKEMNVRVAPPPGADISAGGRKKGKQYASPNGRAVTTEDLRDILQQWEDQELLLGPKGSHHPQWIHPDVAHTTLMNAAQSGRLQAMANALGTNLDEPEPVLAWSRQNERSVRRLCRYRIATYLDQGALATILADKLRTTGGWLGGDVEANLFHRILHPQSPRAAVMRLPSTIRGPWIAWAVSNCVTHMALPHRELTDMVLDGGGDDEPFTSGLRGPVAVLAAIRGLNIELDGRRQGSADPGVLQARAVLALRRGQWDAARALIAEALDRSRGPSGKRKPCIEGLAMPLLTVVLATGDSTQRILADTNVSSQKSTRMRLILRSALGRPGARLDEVDQQYQLGELLGDPVIRLAGMLGKVFWPPQENLESPLDTETMCREAATLKADCQDRGLTWLAIQADHLARHFLAQPPAADTGPTSPRLLDLYHARPPWESALELLEGLAELPSSGVPVESDAANQMSFLVSLQATSVFMGFGGGEHKSVEVPDIAQDNRLFVVPRLHKRGRTGWTVGRNVALKTLFDNKVTGLPEEDRGVAATIKPQRQWNGIDYLFSPAIALALVGHPRVFWSDRESGAPVQVVLGAPRIAVKEADGGFTVQVDRIPSPTSKIALDRDNQDRLVVSRFTDAQFKAYEAIAAMPRIPGKGRPQLERALSALARLFTVQSDVDLDVSDAIEERAADACPGILLVRASPGLTVRFSVAPLGPDGPRVAPGSGAVQLVAQIDGQRVQCARNLDDESRRAGEVVDACPTLADAVDGRSVHLSDLTECLETLRMLKSLQDEGKVWISWPSGRPMDVVGHVDFNNLRLQVIEAGGWLAVSGTARINEDLVLSLSDLIAQGVAANGYIDMGDGRFITLATSLSRQLAAMQAAAVGDSQHEGDALKIAPVALGFVGPWLAELASHGGLKTNAAAKKRLASIEAAYARTPEVPATLQAQLRPYQEIGFAFLSRLASFGGGAILADDMGLGKTLMTLALLLERAADGPTLVVAPVSVKHNWIEEARRFAPTLRVQSIDSAITGTIKATKYGPFDVLVCSYSVMTLSIDAFESVKWNTLVLDEAQAIKNPSTQRTRSTQRLVAETRICLTGTPIENHLGDLYSLLNVANPGLLGTPKQFEDRFAKPIQRDGDAQARQLLRTLISPFILRRRKAEVLEDLPERTEITIVVQPDDKERAFYETLRRAALGRLQKSTEQKREDAVSILAELMRMRRAACHPSLVQPDIDVGGAKLDTLVHLVRDMKDGQHRALIFSQFVDFLTLVKDRLTAEGFSWQYLDGSTPEKKRRQAVDDFQVGKGDVFLISLKAGGFGLNLTAADYVIHLDPWWNPAVEDQASDRAHRIGQHRPVTIYRLVSSGSIEEKVVALHHRKRELATDMLAGTEQAGRLDVQTLMSLLQ